MGYNIKTWFYLLLAALTTMVIGDLFAGRQGLLIGFIISLAFLIYLFFFSQQVVLKQWNAVVIEGRDPFGWRADVTELSQKAGLPEIPQTALIPSSCMQAALLCRSHRHSCLVFTEGTLRQLSASERRALIAYFIGLIQSRRGTAHMVASTLSHALGQLHLIVQHLTKLQFLKKVPWRSAIPDAGLLASYVLEPLAALPLTLFTHKSHVFDADRRAVALVHEGDSLSQALWKMAHHTEAHPLRLRFLSQAPLFVVSPLDNVGLNKLFISQPPVTERIKRLSGRLVTSAAV